MGEAEIKAVLQLVPNLLGLGHSKVWTLYDKEADVLYIDFKKPAHADDSELTEDDIIIRYEQDQIIGLTILNASRISREERHEDTLAEL